MATAIATERDPHVPEDGTRMTIDEFLALPDVKRAELEDGVFVMEPPAGGPHGSVNVRLLSRLAPYVLDRALGEAFDSSTAFVLRLDPPLVRSPHVSFVRGDRLDAATEAGSVPLAPDLAVETLSPSDRAAKVQRTIEEYLAHGTRLIWVLDPARRTAAVYAPDAPVQWLTERDDLTGGEVVPGFRVPLALVFGGLAPNR